MIFTLEKKNHFKTNRSFFSFDTTLDGLFNLNIYELAYNYYNTPFFFFFCFLLDVGDGIEYISP